MPARLAMSSVDVPSKPRSAIRAQTPVAERWPPPIGSGAAATSSDAGVTWTETRNLGVPEPLPGSLQFVDSDHAWFGAMAGTRPLVETTDDGGVRWTMILLPAVAPG